MRLVNERREYFPRADILDALQAIVIESPAIGK
jgi:hypothetical protein